MAESSRTARLAGGGFCRERLGRESARSPDRRCRKRTGRSSAATPAAARARSAEPTARARSAFSAARGVHSRRARLKASGLLVPRIGGPSVNPYTPGDLWREISHYGSTPATAQTFVQDHGEKLYRRSMYTYWKRTAPPPNMAAFDAPNREVCTDSRAEHDHAAAGARDAERHAVRRGGACVRRTNPRRTGAKRSGGRTRRRRTTARLRWAFVEATSREPKRQEPTVVAEAARSANAATLCRRDLPAAEKSPAVIGEAPRNAQRTRRRSMPRGRKCVVCC